MSLYIEQQLALLDFNVLKLTFFMNDKVFDLIFFSKILRKKDKFCVEWKEMDLKQSLLLAFLYARYKINILPLEDRKKNCRL